MIKSVFRKDTTKITLFIFIVWMPFYLTFFPGVGLQDEIYSSIKSTEMINQPFLYNIILNSFYRLGRYLGHPIFGMGLLVFILMLITAAAISHVIVWITRLELNKFYSLLLILYYSATPIVIDYAISPIKDRLFAVILLLLIPVLYTQATRHFVFYNKKETMIFSFLMVAMCLARTNGFYIFILMSLVIFALSRFKTKTFAVLCCIFIIGTLPNFFIASDFTESVAVPIQQISRVVFLHRDIPEQEKTFIQTMMPIDKIEQKYNPAVSDSIKWDSSYNRSFVNQNKGAFLKTWLVLLKKYPQDYIVAWYNETNGYWTVRPWIDRQSKMVHAYDRKIYTANEKGYVNSGYAVSEEPLIPEKLKNIFGSYLSYYTFYLPSGVCFLVTVFLGFVFLLKKQIPSLVCILPAIFSSLTFIMAAPINGVFRYTFYYALCLPVYIALPFVKPGRPEHTLSSAEPKASPSRSH
ncbi:DUF6020 family protein [Acetobacter sp.]|uniref:DUF6020 family protein n=1 Tax=Acetobacter sp. TaxID=440 RepID=UPI0039EAA3B3